MHRSPSQSILLMSHDHWNIQQKANGLQTSARADNTSPRNSKLYSLVQKHRSSPGFHLRQPSMPNSASTILCLPAELLAQIIDETRPNDFVAFMLTCKRVYETGSHLIKRDKLCRIAQDSFTFPKRAPNCKKCGKSHSELRGASFNYLLGLPRQPALTCEEWSLAPARFSRLLGMPSQLQAWLLCYKAEYFLNDPHHDCRHCTEDEKDALSIMGRIAVEAGWLAKLMLDVLNSSIILQENFPCWKLFVAVLEGGIYMGESFGDAETLLLEYLLLLNLPNLKHLESVIGGELQNLQILERHLLVLPGIIDETRGRVYFQELRNVVIWVKETDLKTIGPFTLLPKLERLYVHPEYRRFPRKFYEWPSGSKVRSPLKTLILNELTTFTPDELEDFLQHVESLQSLSIELCGLSIERGHETMCKTCIADPDPEHTHTVRYYDPPPISFPSEDRESPDIYPIKAAEHLRMILNHHAAGRGIKRLSMSFTFSGGYYPWLEFSQRIQHFKDFEGLTHLNLDLRFLQPTKDRYIEEGPNSKSIKLLPESLVDLLPSSIEVVGILITSCHHQLIKRLINDIPKNKYKLPALREIVFSAVGSLHPFHGPCGQHTCGLSDEDVHCTSCWNFPQLKVEFQELRIEIKVEGFNDFQKHFNGYFC
jgi:hypothetical protein